MNVAAMTVLDFWVATAALAVLGWVLVRDLWERLP